MGRKGRKGRIETRLAEHQGLALSLSQADGHTQVQLLAATQAWLAPKRGSVSA
jgi:hypothetical protein